MIARTNPRMLQETEQKQEQDIYMIEQRIKHDTAGIFGMDEHQAAENYARLISTLQPQKTTQPALRERYEKATDNIMAKYKEHIEYTRLLSQHQTASSSGTATAYTGFQSDLTAQQHL